MSPWLLAGILYLGSGIGLTLVRYSRGAAPVRLEPGDMHWLAGAVLSGGIAGPRILRRVGPVSGIFSSRSPNSGFGAMHMVL